MMRKPVEEPVVGICAYMTDTKGFRGILKQRFTDFLVHEVSLEGEVCHLTDPLVPKPSKKKHPTSNSHPRTGRHVVSVIHTKETPGRFLTVPEGS